MRFLSPIYLEWVLMLLQDPKDFTRSALCAHKLGSPLKATHFPSMRVDGLLDWWKHVSFPWICIKSHVFFYEWLIWQGAPLQLNKIIWPWVSIGFGCDMWDCWWIHRADLKERSEAWAGDKFIMDSRCTWHPWPYYGFEVHGDDHILGIEAHLNHLYLLYNFGGNYYCLLIFSTEHVMPPESFLMSKIPFMWGGPYGTMLMWVVDKDQIFQIGNPQSPVSLPLVFLVYHPFVRTGNR